MKVKRAFCDRSLLPSDVGGELCNMYTIKTLSSTWLVYGCSFIQMIKVECRVPPTVLYCCPSYCYVQPLSIIVDQCYFDHLTGYPMKIYYCKAANNYRLRVMQVLFRKKGLPGSPRDIQLLWSKSQQHTATDGGFSKRYFLENQEVQQMTTN